MANIFVDHLIRQIPVVPSPQWTAVQPIQPGNKTQYPPLPAFAATQTWTILTKTGPESVPIAGLPLSRPLEPI